MPLSKKNIKIYVGIYLLWLAVLVLSDPCSDSTPLQEIWLMSFSVLAVVFAWRHSIYSSIAPESVKNLCVLAGKAIYELFAVTILFGLVSLPVFFFVPAVQCYTARAYNTEILSAIVPVKQKLTELIESSGDLNNDYSGIKIPSHDRIDHFEITSEGKILVHSQKPEFTVYLTPSFETGSVKWDCKAYPKKQSPAVCR